MKIKDNKGKEHEIGIGAYRGTVIVASDLPMDTPVASLVILDSGECRSAIRLPEFRKNKQLDELFIDTQRLAIVMKILPVTSGELFSLVHKNHGSNKDIARMGARLQEVGDFNRWSFPIDEVLSGKVNERTRV
jgi:hypothetical protein